MSCTTRASQFQLHQPTPSSSAEQKHRHEKYILCYKRIHNAKHNNPLEMELDSSPSVLFSYFTEIHSEHTHKYPNLISQSENADC